jgi:cytochrome c oxidase assembly protein subunit 15
MVKSGLDRPKPEYQKKPRVSTYRLTVHLSMALSLYSLLIWNAATLLRKPQHLQLTPENYKITSKFRGLGIGLVHLVAINLLTG